jgi:hypothetical protein
MGHKTGFFARPYEDWSVRDYIEYMRLKRPVRTDREILGTWTTTLKSIMRCSKQKCCSKGRRARASELEKAYRQKMRFVHITPFSVTDLGDLYAPLSDLYARFGLDMLEWHFMGRTFTLRKRPLRSFELCFAQCPANPHVRRGLVSS